MRMYNLQSIFLHLPFSVFLGLCHLRLHAVHLWQCISASVLHTAMVQASYRLPYGQNKGAQSQLVTSGHVHESRSLLPTTIHTYTHPAAGRHNVHRVKTSEKAKHSRAADKGIQAAEQAVADAQAQQSNSSQHIFMLFTGTSLTLIQIITSLPMILGPNALPLKVCFVRVQKYKILEILSDSDNSDMDSEEKERCPQQNNYRRPGPGHESTGDIKSTRGLCCAELR
ncbi:hypothetical protein B0H19DRAFT_1068084 [Mycena capillaripes]|nr:hypothetical protein B0H19DRAFT_1086559 [Mycena capillaripes]KAJ6564548.1 hypothetical protein B0H19DRAFT_1068084 [Mycena capillaripes]